MNVRLDNTMDIRAASAAPACAGVLALGLALLHAVLRTDWQRFIGSPSMATGVFLVFPAAWLVIREHCLAARLPRAERRARGRAHRCEAWLQPCA